MSEMTRRALLQGAAATGAAMLWPTATLAKAEGFRFVHFTDLHIQPELRAPEGVSAAIKKLLALDPRPDFVVLGGDSVMDWNAVSHDRADVQFKLLEEALKPLEMPLYYTLGNHDVYGWSRRDETAVKEPDYGKKMWQDRVAKGAAYRSFDHKGWHFIILDSIAPLPGGWRSEIDDAQLQWFKTDLERTGKQTPIVIVTHVPLITAFTLYNTATTAATPDTLIVRNGKEARDLFLPYNVKAVLQGHTHVVEECTYMGTHYITSGAVCGEWWKGPRLGVHPEGFAVCDVTPAAFSWKYVDYGWKAVSA